MRGKHIRAELNEIKRNEIKGFVKTGKGRVSTSGVKGKNRWYNERIPDRELSLNGLSWSLWRRARQPCRQFLR
jgi:hypothetical protein